MPQFALGALLAGVAALRPRRARASPTTRRVTMEEIAELTIDQVPDWWRPRISIGMARRDNIVQAIKKRIESCFFIMAFSKDAMTTVEQEEARAMFPETVSARVLKNTLVKRAMLGTPWEEFSTHLEGATMYVFVDSEEDVRATVQAYLKMEKSLNRVAKLAEMYEKNPRSYTFELRSLVGGVLRDDYSFIGPEDFVKLKDFPTKTELIARIAGSIKQVTQKVAVGVNQVPQKLAIGTKKVVEKMEEDGKATVSEVVA